MGESNNNNKLPIAVANISLVPSFEWSHHLNINSKLRPKFTNTQYNYVALF
jgi:hypothetical protein